MTSSQIIVLVTPLFLGAIAVEWAVARHRGHPGPQLDDALSSMALGMLSQVTGVLGGLVVLGLYTWACDHLALVQADAFWTHPLGWLLALVFYDLCYYWYHRKSHEVALLWAAHVVHHQSQSYNLSTALRQTSSGFVFGWLFYLPMAVAGVPPLVFAVVGLVDLLYQFWVHTEQVGRLGAFDRWFCSPSNHRVHHATNDRYLDRNHGGILMVWDRLFGTFAPEDPAEPCVYGTRAPLQSWNPLWANTEVYAHLWRTAAATASWSDRLRVWVRPPGWRPADVALREGSRAFDPRAVPRYAMALTPGQTLFAAGQFGLMLGLTAAFLWFAGTWSMAQQGVGMGALAVAYWAQGLHLQQRLSPWACLMVQAAALSAVSAAWGWTGVHLAAKPAALIFAIFHVATNQHPSSDDGTFSIKKRWLLAAATLSLAGDVLLMGPPHWFVGGLAAFLLAHLAYLALLTRDTPWWPRPRAMAITLALGAAVYGVLLQGVPAGLRLPVAAYVAVLAAMAAQAWGRAAVQGTVAAQRVAWGSAAFMLSDALLGVNRFVQPLPAAALWVLGTYGLAQALIVFHALHPPASGQAVHTG